MSNCNDDTGMLQIASCLVIAVHGDGGASSRRATRQQLRASLMHNASYVRNRRATRRTSSHTREAFPAHATLAEAGEPMLGSDVGAWQVLEGSSVAELLAQNSDPLRALSTGEIPAIILRGALDASVAAAVSQRLLMNDQQSLGLFERPGDRKKMARGLLNFGGFGVMLSRTISAKPSKITEDAARYRRLFEQHQLMQP